MFNYRVIFFVFRCLYLFFFLMKLVDIVVFNFLVGNVGWVVIVFVWYFWVNSGGVLNFLNWCCFMDKFCMLVCFLLIGISMVVMVDLFFLGRLRFKNIILFILVG